MINKGSGHKIMFACDVIYVAKGIKDFENLLELIITFHQSSRIQSQYTKPVTCGYSKSKHVEKEISQ
jgi:hypothetical protein